MFPLTADLAIRSIETRIRMTELTRLRAPMMRVPVFRVTHAQQFASFGRETILATMISETEPGLVMAPTPLG